MIISEIYLDFIIVHIETYIPKIIIKIARTLYS